jgi:ferredoxin--NADP+ reductase
MGGLMFPILEKVNLAETVYSVIVEAHDIAARALAGQFVILRIDETGERFPLTLCDWSPEEGWIRPSEICEYGHVVCVGGGVGIAAIHPICRALREAGNRVTGLLGARSADLLILEEEMGAVVDELVLTTDDGSRGMKGRVTWALEELLKKESADLVIAIGPAIMMKFAAAVTREFEVPTKVSLNSIMLDGTGMCGTCRCEVEGKTRFACVDGPEFDGHEVDWSLLLSRLDQYKDEEELARRLPLP